MKATLAIAFALVINIECNIKNFEKNNVGISNLLFKDNILKNDLHPKKTNPYLYFNKEDIPKMVQQASSTHSQIASEIYTAGTTMMSDTTYYLPPVRQDVFDSRWNELYGNNLCVFAIYCVLNPRNKEAINYAKTYMDRMANYTDWYVAASRNVDEVPVAHSLTGFTTAYDFLFNYLEPDRRIIYLDKIVTESRNLYQLLKKKRGGWTRQYIHNHAPTNLLALMLGGMLSYNHNVEEAKDWIDITREHFDKAMTLLANVIDGSLDEGVAYGSYTSRGITQYIYLAKRHFGIDHTKNPWLREHFWFYYATVLPGFQRTVGIADSNYNWFYGPESQLVFLDKFVMRNGYGNWLADRIRNSKSTQKPLARSASQVWCTLHTEYIFYDPKIKSTEPIRPMNSSLHVFSDWGVATYGGGQPHGKGNTFLSFKSGSLNGEAVKDIIENKLYAEWVEGWKSFNAGHEHPDQNSFVFAPNGRYFITEGLYSAKFTDLNNVLLFAPYDGSQCNFPWQGQNGECFKWLRYATDPIPRGEIVSAAEDGGMVFIAGESMAAYPPELGLRSVFRALTLINPEVLIVIDSVELEPESKIKRASAMFHNKLHRFDKDKHLGYNGAKLEFPEGTYKMFWFSSDGQSPVAQIKKMERSDGMGDETNHVNVTYNIVGNKNLMAYVFLGPSYDVQSAWFHESNSHSILSIIINGVEYKLRLGLDTKMRDVKHTTAELRKETTRFGGYATVEVENEKYYFGVGALYPDDLSTNSNDAKLTFNSKTKLFKNDCQKLIEVKKVVSDYGNKRGDEFKQYKHSIDEQNETEYVYFAMLLLMLSLFVSVFLIWGKILKRKFQLSKFVIVLTLLWSLLILYQFGCAANGGCMGQPSWGYSTNGDAVSMSDFSMPFVVASQLPESGGEILEHMFDNLTDFMYIPAGKDELNIPVKSRNSDFPDIRHWAENTDMVAKGWFSSLNQFTKVFFNNQPISDRVRTIKRIVRQNVNSVRVLNLLSGFWTSKLSWIQDILKDKNTRYIIIVQDPRIWIENLKCNIDDITREKIKVMLDSITQSYDDLLPQEVLPGEYETFVSKYEIEELTTKEILAAYWAINTLSSIRELYETVELDKIQILRMEDVMKNPEKTYRGIFAKLGMPVSTARLNRLIRFTKRKEIEESGKLTAPSKEKSCLKLSYLEITEIENIAGSVMELLNYHTSDQTMKWCNMGRLNIVLHNKREKSTSTKVTRLKISLE